MNINSVKIYKESAKNCKSNNKYIILKIQMDFRIGGNRPGDTGGFGVLGFKN